MSGSGFFAVGKKTFIEACALGINEAAVFLVLARGSGGDNESTRWSSEAASKYLHVRWSKADEAIKSLIRRKLVTKDRAAKVPAYWLKKQGEPIWLPNALVDGVSDEVPSIARLRQTQDSMCLRLFVEFYSEQNLREDGGISASIVRRNYERRRIGQRGPYEIWGFTEGVESVTWGAITTPHYRHKSALTEQELAARKNSAVDFFRRFGRLTSLGLVDWVPFLFEGPEGEPVHPYWSGSDIHEECLLAEACENAAWRCLTERQSDHLVDHPVDLLAPMPAHFEQATAIGIARLRYRPRTAMTRAWWAHTQDACRRYIAQYDAIAAREERAPSSCVA